MVWIEKDMKDVCLLPQPKDIIFPESRSNPDFHLLCNKLNGHLSVAETQSKMDALIEEFKLKMPEAFRGYLSCMPNCRWKKGVNSTVSLFSNVLGRV